MTHGPEQPDIPEQAMRMTVAAREIIDAVNHHAEIDDRDRVVVLVSTDDGGVATVMNYDGDENTFLRDVVEDVLKHATILVERLGGELHIDISVPE